MIPQPIVLLLSGGLDSVTLLYYLRGEGRPVHCALFNYKQRHAQELEFAKYHCHRLGCIFTTIDIPTLRGSSLTDGSGSVVVPWRNATLLSLAVNLAASISTQEVAIGCNADDADMFPDCRKEFIDSFNASLRSAEIDVQVVAPFLTWHKWQIAGLAEQIGVPHHMTWSCYKGGAKPCGECPACKKREEAFSAK